MSRATSYRPGARLLWQSWRNWRSGYRFDSIQRCRYCDHTSPTHYRTCRLHARARRLAAGSYVELGGQFVDLPMEDER